MLNSDTRYSITDGRSLDKSEEQQVYDKIIDTYGQESWNQKNENEQKQIIEIISSHYLQFLKSRLHLRENFILTLLDYMIRLLVFFKLNIMFLMYRKKYLWHPSEQEKLYRIRRVL